MDCGSSDATRAVYLEATCAMGRDLPRRGHIPVFGGGRTGMLGAPADAALQGGGRVIGIISEGLNRPELAHAHPTELVIVGLMR